MKTSLAKVSVFIQIFLNSLQEFKNTYIKYYDRVILLCSDDNYRSNAVIFFFYCHFAKQPIDFCCKTTIRAHNAYNPNNIEHCRTLLFL